MNEYLRRQLDFFIQHYGTTSAFVAKKIGVSETLICLFRRNARNLGESNLVKLRCFLERMRLSREEG